MLSIRYKHSRVNRGLLGWNPPVEAVAEHATSQRCFMGVVSREWRRQGLKRKRRTVRLKGRSEILPFFLQTAVGISVDTSIHDEDLSRLFPSPLLPVHPGTLLLSRTLAETGRMDQRERDVVGIWKVARFVQTYLDGAFGDGGPLDDSIDRGGC